MDWSDIAKAIAIFSVYFSHYVDLTRDKVLLAYILSFNVPIFFLIGGMFFRESDLNKTFKEVIQKKAVSRILPYGVFGLATYLVWLGLLYLKYIGAYQGTATAASVEVIRPLVGLVYGNGSWITFNPALWFLPCYLITELLFYVLRKHVHSQYRVFFFVMIFASAGFAYSYTKLPQIPFGGDVALVVLLFFATGYLMRNGYFAIKLRLWLVVTLLVSGFVLSQLNGRIDINNRMYGNIFFLYAAGLCNSIVWLEISKRFVYLNKILIYIGKNTLPLFMLQGCAGILLNLILRFVLNLRSPYITGLPSTVIYTISAVIVILPVIYLINRHIPVALGVTKHRLQRQASGREPAYEVSPIAVPVKE